MSAKVFIIDSFGSFLNNDSASDDYDDDGVIEQYGDGDMTQLFSVKSNGWVPHFTTDGQIIKAQFIDNYIGSIFDDSDEPARFSELEKAI